MLAAAFCSLLLRCSGCSGCCGCSHRQRVFPQPSAGVQRLVPTENESNPQHGGTLHRMVVKSGSKNMLSFTNIFFRLFSLLIHAGNTYHIVVIEQGDLN